jgi:hypothetical protein
MDIIVNYYIQHCGFTNIHWQEYCERCECCFITKGIFCECCGMQLRATLTERELKEKARAKKKPVTAVL